MFGLGLIVYLISNMLGVHVAATWKDAFSERTYTPDKHRQR